MSKAEKNIYDAIIIGAGISGLVCGCYLAKAGMKVLIVEQHNKPGGYCTSFKRKGFVFDAAAHSFAGYRKTTFGIILRDLGIDKKIILQRFDPSDIIVTPDFRVAFWADLDKTIEDFQFAFPEESNNIKKFFYYLTNPKHQSLTDLRSCTFKNLLDKYFINEKLKAILSFPLLGNGGLPPSLLSAFIGIKIFTYLLDGGYYSEASMQTLPDALTAIFKEVGGKLRLSCSVKRIRVKNSEVKGIVTEKGDFTPSKYIISNCDTRQTFFKLLGKKLVDQEFITKINNMSPTLSMFIIYLGLDKLFKNISDSRQSIWFLSKYNLDKTYISAKKGDLNNISGYLVNIIPKNRIISIYLNAPFKSKTYWENNKNKLCDFFIKNVETHIIPGLSKHIIYKETATPYTLYRYTSNYKGAAYGWESTPSQLAVPDFRKPSFIKNLYLSGHWITQGLGIPGVAYLGYDTAKNILRKENIELNILRNNNFK